MNEELTSEVLEAMAKCNKTSCSECLAVDYCSKYNKPMASIATALLEERAKPKVWDKAPDDATVAVVEFQRDCGELLENLSYATYTRELPKTRARIMAEEIASAHISNKSDLVDIIEQTINNHMEELEGKE